mmetsp:Transcript_3348/g.6112  ORF Transcript_3348/g.6112 Transcript_3348/m.6112 type:complete len:321 (+) Transcript_3348:64-1026(+)
MIIGGRSIARIVPPTQNGPITRLVGTLDIDGKGTDHPLDQCDPFILLDQAVIPKSDLPPFGAHPHRGHSVVTVLLQGKMKSWDSFGAGGLEGTVIKGPASYWVDAGSGVFHDETTIVDDPDDPLQHINLFQLWVGVKEEDRLKPAALQYDINLPVEELWDEGKDSVVGNARYFVGGGGTIQTPHPITVAQVTQHPGKTLKFPIESSHGGFIVHMEGCASYGKEAKDATILKNAVQVLADASNDTENYITVSTPNADDGSDTKYLVCVGEKIQEPWCKKLVANGAIIAQTEDEARAIASNVEKYAKSGLDGGSFSPFGTAK